MITPRTVVSAGHCAWYMKKDHSDVKAIIGMLDRRNYLNALNKKVTDIIPYPGYISNETGDLWMVNDIALFTIEEVDKQSKYYKPICLPPKNVDLYARYN